MLAGCGWAVAGLALGACVGATDRDDFEAEVQARGGGFSEAIVIDAVDRIADEVGTRDFAITHLSVSPLTPTVSAQVRDPRAPDQLDDYAFRGDELVDVEPVRVSAGTDLDATTVPIAAFTLDRLDEAVDAALAEFGVDGAYATAVRLGLGPGAEAGGDPVPTVAVDLESPRAAATARFTADGELLALERR